MGFCLSEIRSIRTEVRNNIIQRYEELKMEKSIPIKLQREENRYKHELDHIHKEHLRLRIQDKPIREVYEEFKRVLNSSKDC